MSAKAKLFGFALMLAASGGCSGGDGSPLRDREPTGAVSQAIGGGQIDGGDPVADTVVYIQGCAGTFITPTAVLTAHHCVFGNSAGKTGFTFPVDVNVGYQKNAWLYTYRVSSVDQVDVMGSRGPQTESMAGNDLAVMWLDDPQPPNYSPVPALGYLNIVRPSLIAPCADGQSCPDESGGTFTPHLGIAGWASQDSATYRTVAYPSEFYHYPGWGGQYWEHIQDSIHTDPGDSGGPLFRVATAPDGQQFRDVLGVNNGRLQRTPHDFDHWCDITRGEPRAWLTSEMTDTSRTPRWMAQHPNHSWKGDVDYTTRCQSRVDADCDSWFDAHDNCPLVANTDQADTNDDGVGDACEGPAPTQTPVCGTVALCSNQQYFGCQNIGYDVALQTLSGRNWVTIATVPRIHDGPYPYFIESSPSSSQYYRVCATTLTSQQITCGTPMLVTPNSSTCSSGGGSGSGTGQNNGTCGHGGPCRIQ